MNFVAFIPLRGGSKSIPLKNIAPIAGKPLAHWCVEAALACSALDAVFVSTDSDAIRNTLERLASPRLHIVARSPETATDTASTESAMVEFARAHRFKHIVLIQATSPLVSAADLAGAIAEYRRQSAGGLVSLVPDRRFLWQPDGQGFASPINYDPLSRPRRQDFAGHWVENGALYITSRDRLLKTGCRISGSIVPFLMAPETLYELDEPGDWHIIESLLRRAHAESGQAAIPGDIRLVVTDVDGVLTDAGMYYSEKGDELKRFNTRDGMGVALLRKRGVPVAILTSESTKLLARRARKLGIEFVVQGAKEKLPALRRIARTAGVPLANIAYLGDDVNDLEPMREVGFAAAPADAAQQVKSVARYICQARGGGGCLRELADLLIARSGP